MQSSFEVLEWESTSKAQDSLVHQLFGDISSSKLSTCSAVLETANQVNASKAEKRKALKNEESTAKLKKKRKDKRQKNKFKQIQELSSEHSENSKNVNLTAEEIFKEPVSVSTNSENFNGRDRKKAKKKKRNDETKEKDVRSKKEKKNIKTDQNFNFHDQLTGDRDGQSRATCDDEIISARGINQKACIDNANQFKESVETATPLNADIEKIPSSFEGPNKCEREKVQKRKKRKKRKMDQDGSRRESELLDMRESTPEVTHEHKKRKKTHKLEQDSCCDKQITKHSPEIKDTNSSILSSSSWSKSSLQEKMTKQLESSRFRWINEQLYTTTGDEAVAMFSKDPNLFDIYHRGFTNQVKLWPVNPVNKIIEWLKKR